MILALVIIFSATSIVRELRRRRLWDSMTEFHEDAQHDLSFREEQVDVDGYQRTPYSDESTTMNENKESGDTADDDERGDRPDRYLPVIS